MSDVQPGGFLKLERALVRSWHGDGLSSDAVKLLIDMASWHNGRNNGAISYGLADAVRCLRCSKRTAIRCFAELREAGLIEATQKGSYTHRNGARKGTATLWRLTFLP